MKKNKEINDLLSLANSIQKDIEKDSMAIEKRREEDRRCKSKKKRQSNETAQRNHK